MYGKTVARFIETGQELINAKAGLVHGEFTAMVEEDLPFRPNTAQRLMVIARDQRLVNPARAYTVHRRRMAGSRAPALERKPNVHDRCGIRRDAPGTADGPSVPGRKVSGRCRKNAISCDHGGNVFVYVMTVTRSIEYADAQIQKLTAIIWTGTNCPQL